MDAKYLLDIRIHNNSQLAGFTKKGNIDFFTEELTGLQYEEMPILAPDEEMFKRYRKDKDWRAYEARYVELLRDRKVSGEISGELFESGAVLLCSEPKPDQCHRRLAAEYLKDEAFREASIVHL